MLSTQRAILALAALALATGASAQTEGDASTDELLRSFERRLEESERRIAEQDNKIREQSQEIASLRSASDGEWLTEQRAEEIRSLVADVLADADTRASFQNGLIAGWSDGFFLASPDGRFKLDIDGQLQFRWIYNYHDLPDRHRQGFEIPRAKLTFSGHIFSDSLEYLIRMDQTRNEPGLVTGLYFLQDAWARYYLNDEWSVRFGQFKLPFNREELVPSAYQLAVERSLVNESFNLGRTQGIELAFTGQDDKFMFAIGDGAADSLGGFGSVGGGGFPLNTPALDEDVEYAVTGRWEHLFAGEWNQFADFTSPPGEEFGMLFGLGGHMQEQESGTSTGPFRNEVRWYGFTADLSLEWGGANAFAALVWHYIDNFNFGQIDTPGIVLQGGVFFTPKWEVFARWEYGWWDANFEVTDLNLLTLGTNYYIDGHDVKWTTDIGIGFSRVDAFWDSNLAGFRRDFDETEPQIVFRTQFQLLF